MITHVGGDGRPAANIRSQHLWGGLGCALVIICPINSVSSLPICTLQRHKPAGTVQASCGVFWGAGFWD